MTLIRFQPWVGKRYGSFFGKKVLVLGESHYHGEGERINDDPNTTKQVVQLQFDGSGTTYPFFTHIAKTFLGPDRDLTPADKAEFWDQVAFYNFVQESVGIGARVRPTREQWEASEPAFLEVLERLQPDTIIAFGFTLWDNLPGNGHIGPWISDTSRPHSWFYPHGSGRALTSAVRHPSSGGYSSREWHPHVMKVLKMPRMH